MQFNKWWAYLHAPILLAFHECLSRTTEGIASLALLGGIALDGICVEGDEAGCVLAARHCLLGSIIGTSHIL